MDKEELDKVKAQAEEVIRGVAELQDEIKKYKSGAESFELATGALALVAEREKEVTKRIEKYLEAISKSNVKKILADLDEVSEKVIEVKDEYGEIEKKVLAQQREEKKLEKEIRELRGELAEFKDLMKKSEEKKAKVFGLFKKR